MTKQILAALGAVGAALMAGSTIFSGATAFGADLNQSFAVTGFLMGGAGTIIATGVAFYKANSV